MKPTLSEALDINAIFSTSVASASLVLDELIGVAAFKRRLHRFKEYFSQHTLR